MKRANIFVALTLTFILTNGPVFAKKASQSDLAKDAFGGFDSACIRTGVLNTLYDNHLTLLSVEMLKSGE
jgi:hypothetical protein